MSNCCMRRPAKFHVDSAVRFWAIANIREGGRQTPPPGQARVNNALSNVSQNYTAGERFGPILMTLGQNDRGQVRLG